MAADMEKTAKKCEKNPFLIKVTAVAERNKSNKKDVEQREELLKILKARFEENPEPA